MKNLKILLIAPPSEFKTPVMPLGIAYIASFLREKGFEIFVIDAWAEKLSYEELEKRIAKIKADIIGVYMLSPRYERAKKTIELCRKILPNALITVGGPHVSAVPEETLKDIKELDICVVGEGELTMLDLANGWKEGAPFSSIQGIAFRDKEKIVINPRRDFIKNLDELPFPARDLLPVEKYKTHPPYGRRNPYFSVMTSRGCPFQCAYCSKDVFMNNFRAVSPKRVVDEIEMLVSQYGAKEIHFYDDDFTIQMNRAEVICDEIINRGIKINWSCTTRVDLVNNNLLKKMKKSGCWLISYGVESGNQKILDSINKGIKIEKIIETFHATKKAGILTLGYFMVGLPGDTEETIRDTFELAKKIKADFMSWGILVVYPGSNLFKMIQTGKYKGKLRNLEDGKTLAGTFFGKGKYLVFEDNLSVDRLRQIVKTANIYFYLRPQFLWQSIKNIKSFSDLTYYLRGGLEVIKSALG